MPKKDVKLPDIFKLREAYDASPVFKATFDNFAARQKNRAETLVDQLYWQLRQEVPSVSRADVVKLLKFLETCGCGQFLVGRKGHQSRFRWSVSLIEVGRAASGEITDVEKLPIVQGSKDAEDVLSEQLIEHRFVLRPAMEIRINLPADLSQREANRLADFLRSLPFDSEEQSPRASDAA